MSQEQHERSFASALKEGKGEEGSRLATETKESTKKASTKPQEAVSGLTGKAADITQKTQETVKSAGQQVVDTTKGVTMKAKDIHQGYAEKGKTSIQTGADYMMAGVEGALDTGAAAVGLTEDVAQRTVGSAGGIASYTVDTAKNMAGSTVGVAKGAVTGAAGLTKDVVGGAASTVKSAVTGTVQTLTGTSEEPTIVGSAVSSVVGGIKNTTVRAQESVTEARSEIGQAGETAAREAEAKRGDIDAARAWAEGEKAADKTLDMVKDTASVMTGGLISPSTGGKEQTKQD